MDLGLILSLRNGGLLVPVLKTANTLDLAQVMALMRDQPVGPAPAGYEDLS